jgi:hypothetical protein
MRTSTIASSRRAALLPAASLLLATGCSGAGSGSSSSTATLPASVVALETEYSSPSGTFQLSDVPAVLAALSADANTPTNLPLECDHFDQSIGPCCTSGTATQTDTPTSARAFEGIITYQDCSFFTYDPALPNAEGTVSVTGKVNLVQFLDPDAGFFGIYQGTLSETLLPDGGTRSLSASLAASMPGSMTFVVAIASGSVLATPSADFRAAGGRTFQVQDRLGSWTCAGSGSIGNCVSVGGGRPDFAWMTAADGGVSPFDFDASPVPGDAAGE